MIELDLDVNELGQAQRTVYVQDEPALEIALPQVFAQPELTALQRGKLPHVEGLVAQIFRRYQANPTGPLGEEYQELVTEFQPLFAWTTACWDYLLSTEGCRFVPRRGEQRMGVRGDYRAVTDKDYSRMVHAVFRACVLEFAQRPEALSLSHWLREQVWPRMLDAYRKLDTPPDPRQRTLTPYSYLRCVPYQFLNDIHHELVYSTAQRLPLMAWRAIDAYFLHFYTEAASAETLGGSSEEFFAWLRQGLIKLLINDRLVYCLLRQIERY
ncbi:MAG: hypothetical protein HYZ91_03030 [Candidatus Omnitrophica bacterium]|nr:hypothetical protein [Candidatus Omnitrophota bacterium]